MRPLFFALAVAAATGAASAQTGESPAWAAEARQTAMTLPPRLLSVLQDEIARSGPEGAIASCREQAPQLARTASEQTGWLMRRVSLRNRNPKAVPDAWERSALEEFDRRAAAGEAPARLEKAETVVEDGKTVWRYLRALPTLELCTQCHGAADQLSPAVRQRLAALYPDDRATGYRVGDIRGAITLRKTAP